MGGDPDVRRGTQPGPLVGDLLSALAASGVDHRILVVDDHSPDGTGEIADELALIHPAVQVLHRPRKDGLSHAYLDGFERAMEGGADLVVTMDADFSHDPHDVLRLLEAADRADIVIGSRYVTGGRVAGGRVARRIISRAGCAYARTVLGLPVRDLTAGFRCIRRPVIEGLCSDGTPPSGYSFQIEWTFRAVRRGLRVVEVPITFRERRAGASKMKARMVLDALWRVPALLRGPVS